MGSGGSRSRQGGNRGVGSRHRRHPVARLAHRGDQQRARIGDRRRARIADQGQRFAPGQQREHLFCNAFFVVLVDREQPFLDSVVAEQPAGNPRIFGRHHGHALQYLQRPQGDVSEIPNRSGHYI